MIGVSEGVFIGTGGFNTEYGVYMSSAANIYQNTYYYQQLTIYEVQGLSTEQRQQASEFAMNAYGAGYSYAGLITGNRNNTADKQWYCTELVVAALERADVTFYIPSGIGYKQLRTPTLPVYMSEYRTIIDGGWWITTPWGSSTPLLQTWP